jgi:hypothetical protein
MNPVTIEIEIRDLPQPPVRRPLADHESAVLEAAREELAAIRGAVRGQRR